MNLLIGNTHRKKPEFKNVEETKLLQHNRWTQFRNCLKSLLYFDKDLIVYFNLVDTNPVGYCLKYPDPLRQNASRHAPAHAKPHASRGVNVALLWMFYELLWNLDLLGYRVPAHFASRGSGPGMQDFEVGGHENTAFLQENLYAHKNSIKYYVDCCSTLVWWLLHLYILIWKL